MAELNVGCIAYATKSGLGLLAKRFYDHGYFQRLLQLPHPRYIAHPEWYRKEDLFTGRDMKFLDGLNCLLLLENAFSRWDVVKEARRRGIRVVLCVMYEWTPFPIPVPADLYLCPSLLDADYYKSKPHLILPIPVEVPWKKRERVRTFVHNVGHGGVGFRNGTPEILEAMRMVKSPIKLIVLMQPKEPRTEQLYRKWRGEDPRIEMILRDFDDSELWEKWEEGQAFLFPESYNGLSLPLQEAYASGMLVIAGDRYPMNTWLPKEPLIPVHKYVVEKLAVTFKKATYTPDSIAEAIDKWHDQDVSEFSLLGKEWGEMHSYEVLKDRYMDAFRG